MPGCRADENYPAAPSFCHPARKSRGHRCRRSEVHLGKPQHLHGVLSLFAWRASVSEASYQVSDIKWPYPILVEQLEDCRLTLAQIMNDRLRFSAHGSYCFAGV